MSSDLKHQRSSPGRLLRILGEIPKQTIGRLIETIECGQQAEKVGSVDDVGRAKHGE
jgi:hypothetical protein